MADQDDVPEFFCLDEAGYVLDVGAYGNLRRQKVGTLTKAGQGRGPDRMTKPSQAIGDVAPDPASSISPMYEDVDLGRDVSYLTKC